MRSISALPSGYREACRIDLIHNRRQCILVNALSILIFVLLAVPVHLRISAWTLFDLSDGFLPYLLRFLVLLGGTVAYMVLHELTHGAVMHLCETKHVRYGFTGLYAFAGSSDYYGRLPYLCIALAPIVLFGILLALLCTVVPRSWFWVVYVFQLTNLSGAAGDLYVTVRMLRLPADLLVQDSGTSMIVYTNENRL